jgi:hypothetical protein
MALISFQIVKSGDHKPSHYYCYGDAKVWWDNVPYSLTFDTACIRNVIKLSARKTKISFRLPGDTHNYDTLLISVAKNRVVARMNGEEAWQNEEFTFIEVERVYCGRIDCMAVPGGARLAA